MRIDGPDGERDGELVLGRCHTTMFARMLAELASLGLAQAEDENADEMIARMLDFRPGTGTGGSRGGTP